MTLYLNPLMGNVHSSQDPSAFNKAGVSLFCPEHGTQHVEYSTDVDTGEKHYFCGIRTGGDFEDGQHCDRPLPGPCDCGCTEASIMSQFDYDSLRDSIQEHGLHMPISVEVAGARFNIIAGRMRLKVVRELGHTTIRSWVYGNGDPILINVPLELIDDEG